MLKKKGQIKMNQEVESFKDFREMLIDAVDRVQGNPCVCEMDDFSDVIVDELTELYNLFQLDDPVKDTGTSFKEYADKIKEILFTAFMLRDDIKAQINIVETNTNDLWNTYNGILESEKNK